MVDEHAEPAPGAGPELVDDVDQIVDAAEVLDHHSLDAQVVAPHLLDKLGVVAALDVDPAGERHPGARSGNRHRARCGPRRGRGRRTSRRDEDHRPTVNEVSGADREGRLRPWRSSSSIRPNSIRTTAPT